MRTWVHWLVVICMVFNSVTPVVSSWLLGSKGAASVFMAGEQTPTPTETPTAMPPEETVRPTETPLPTETVQPMLTATPTTTIETETPPTEEKVEDWLEWEIEPTQLAQFGEMQLSWRWLHPLPEKAEWILVFPEGVLPHYIEEQGLVYDSATRELEMGTLGDGSVKVSAEDEIADAEIAFQAWIVLDGEVLAKDIVQVAVEPFKQSISVEGGEIRALDDRITIDIPKGALTEDAKFSIRQLRGNEVLSAPAGGMVFEINASDMAESRGMHQFDEPIVITAQYDETAVWGHEENLAMVYYDETLQDWRFLPSAVNVEENTVTAETTHLTTFSFNIQDWQSSSLPTLDGATTSLFSGGANYGMSFWLPPGPGGFQPSFVLSYSSETVDAADSRTQASWVGMGWSLDTGYIERNQNATRKDLVDDTFTLVLNGAGYLLIEDDGDPDGNSNTTDYHTRDESYLLIRRYLQRDTIANKDTSYWVVWDKSGGQYVFGDRAVYPMEGCDTPSKEIWRWSLTEARSPVYDSAVDGPKIIYQYDHYTTGKRDCDKANKPNHLTDVSVYPRTIIYPNQRYRISLIRSGFGNQFTQAPERKDYLEIWEDETTLMFYQKERLSEIVVEHDADGNGSYETVLRRYDFLYNDGVIFPGVLWPHDGQNGQTVTLSSVREYDGAGNSLPATEFVYGDQMHLTEVKNGYDGRVVFNYETDPWAYTEGPHTYQVNYGQSYRCDNGGTFLTKFPGDRFYPGGMVKFSAGVRSDGNYQLGISGHSSCNNGQCVWGSVNPSSQTVATDILKMPIHAIEARMRVHNLDNDAECYVSWQRFTAIPAHYRVLSKQTFVGNTLMAQTTYSYTEPAVNDENHSAIAADNRCTLPDPSASNYQELERNYACYNRKYAQFRGHAQVIETDSSGMQTVYKFHQDDIYNGKVYEVILQDAEGDEYQKTTTTYAYQVVPTSATYPYNPFAGVRYWDVTGRWIYTVYQDEWLGDGTGNKLGKRVSYYYDEAFQGNLQYGNATRVYEAAWDGSAWQPYRMQLSRFYPNVVKNMVAYPSVIYTYRCPPGWCQPGGNDIAWQNEMSLVLNWYDGVTNWWTPPERGLVTTQRQKLTNSGQFRDTQYEYDAWGNLVKTIAYKQPSISENSLPSGASQTTTTCYGASVSGQPNCPSDGYFTYPLKVINNLGQATTIAYNYNLGVPISETGPNGAATTTTATYDGFGRLLTIIRPVDSSSSPTIRITYSDAQAGCTGAGCYFSTLAEQRLENGTYYQLRKIYHGAGQLIQTQVLNATINGTTGKRIVTDFTYNADLRQQTQSVPYSPTGCTTLYCTPDTSVPKTTTTFDLLGRVETVLYPDSTADVYSYTVWQNRLIGTHQDRNGHTSQTATNVWGQMISSTSSDVGMSYSYDVLNRLVSATSASGANTTITYDRAGRKLTLNDPDMGSWSYTYDAIGNLMIQTDARGCTMTLAYDDLNRLSSKTYAAGCPTTATVSYTYDAGTYGIGHRTGMTDGSGSSSWEYDARGRVTKETLQITGSGTFQTNWTYNSADQVKTIRYPGNNYNGQGETVTYSYLPQMALNTVVGTSSYVSSSKYDAVGRLTERNLGSSVRQNYSYVDWEQEGGGRLATLTAGVSPNYNNRLNLNYEYDAVGNITEIEDTLRGGTQTQSFEYDALNRLTSAVATGGTQGVYPLESYTYASESGNLASKAGVVYGYQDSSHAHGVTHENGVQKYWYDANGNQTKRILGSDTYDLAYDGENRLMEVKKNGAVLASFVYNGNGECVKSVMNGATTTFVGRLLEWSGSSSTMKKYYYAGRERIGMRTGSTVNYILGDHLGSTSVTTDSAGNNAVYALYKPWGEMRYNSGSLPTKYTYTGQYSNVADFGLMNYNARWYDPALGRFAQADTIIPQPGDPQAWDRYAYVENNPLRYTDPSGHFCVEIGGVTTCSKDDDSRGYWYHPIPARPIISLSYDDEKAMLIDIKTGDRIVYQMNGENYQAQLVRKDGQSSVFWDFRTRKPIFYSEIAPYQIGFYKLNNDGTYQVVRGIGNWQSLEPLIVYTEPYVYKGDDYMLIQKHQTSVLCNSFCQASLTVAIVSALLPAPKITMLVSVAGLILAIIGTDIRSDTYYEIVPCIN